MAASFVSTTASQSFMLLFFTAISLNNQRNSSGSHVVRNDLTQLTSLVKTDRLLMCFLLFNTCCEISPGTAPHG